jgi:hypothetical protein
MSLSTYTSVHNVSDVHIEEQVFENFTCFEIYTSGLGGGKANIRLFVQNPDIENVRAGLSAIILNEGVSA